MECQRTTHYANLDSKHYNSLLMQSLHLHPWPIKHNLIQIQYIAAYQGTTHASFTFISWPIKHNLIHKFSEHYDLPMDGSSHIGR